MTTAEDLLGFTLLRLSVVHASSERVALRWVATSELVDPTPFLEGGELVLTTGLEMARWASSEWSAYVERLVGAGVAALGLGTGLTHATPPVGLVNACRLLDLTLLEVPRDTPFIAISLAVADLLRGAEAQAARAASEMQRVLTQAALQLDVGHLLDQLASLLSADCALLHGDGSLFLRSVGPGAHRADLDQAAAEVLRMQGHGFRTSSTLIDADRMLSIRPIGVTGPPSHYLAVCVEDGTSEPARSTLETACAILSLAVERLSQKAAADERLTSRAIDFLLQGDRRTAEVLTDATEQGPRVPPRVRVVCATGPAASRRDIVAACRRARELVTIRDDYLIGVVADGRAGSLAEHAAGAGLMVGVGQLVPSGRVAESYHSAIHALSKTSPEARVRRWDDLVQQGPVGLIPVDVAASFAESLLGNLDKGHLTILGSYLRHNGSRGAIAQELGLHRNTVRSRVTEIERLLSANLGDPQTRAALWIALQVVGHEASPASR